MHRKSNLINYSLTRNMSIRSNTQYYIADISLEGVNEYVLKVNDWGLICSNMFSRCNMGSCMADLTSEWRMSIFKKFMIEDSRYRKKLIRVIWTCMAEIKSEGVNESRKKVQNRLLLGQKYFWLSTNLPEMCSVGLIWTSV